MTIYPSVANGEPINSDELTFKRGNLFSLFFRPWTFQLNAMMKIDAEEFVWFPLKYFGGSLWRDNKVFAKPVNLFHRGIRFSWNAEAGFISSYFLKGKVFFVKKKSISLFSLSSFPPSHHFCVSGSRADLSTFFAVFVKASEKIFVALAGICPNGRK